MLYLVLFLTHVLHTLFHFLLTVTFALFYATTFALSHATMDCCLTALNTTMHSLNQILPNYSTSDGYDPVIEEVRYVSMCVCDVFNTT